MDSGIELLQSAAARVAGAHGERALLDSLRTLAATPGGDTVRSAAAYALARLGEPDGVETLIACLELPTEAYVAPVQAAGSLARLGDVRGLPVVERALRSSNEIVRAVAVKQLPFFGPQGRPLITDALKDSDPEIARRGAHPARRRARVLARCRYGIERERATMRGSVKGLSPACRYFELDRPPRRSLSLVGSRSSTASAGRKRSSSAAHCSRERRES